MLWAGGVAVAEETSREPRARAVGVARVEWQALSAEAGYWSPRAVRVAFARGAGRPRCPLPSLQPAPGVLGGVREAQETDNIRLWCPEADLARVRLGRLTPVVEVTSPAGGTVTAVSPAPGPAGRFRLTFPLRPDESLHGLGLQVRQVAQRGHKRFLKVNADPRDDAGNSHVPIPFLLSTAGYGVLVNTHEYTWWDLGADDPARWWVEVPGDAAEVFIIVGDLRAQVREYLALTGAPALPPKWGLGFWYRPKSGWNEAEVKAVLEDFGARGIPVQVVGLEPSWQTHSYSCSYVWNRDQWPDPAEFVAWCAQRGIRVNLWEHAYVHPSSPIHDALAKEGLAADRRVWDGLVPDFTLPRAREVLTDFHRREHVAIGVAGYKLDECDGSDFTGGWFFPDDARFPSGLSGAQMHNIFGFLYSRTMHELFEGRGTRSYFLCRANYAGGQAWATCNYSDLYGFDEYVRMAANSGFACSPWCPEVRDIADPGDFLRRSQVVFTSWLAMINAWASGIKPWEQGPETEAIFRRYVRLRERLLPYIYAAWQGQARTGQALNRSLAMDFQDDAASRAVDDEYLFGPWLLVAPVLSGAEREVYLPPARWRDFWTGQEYQGPTRVRYAAPLERLPMFLREGAVVAMLPEDQEAFGRWTALRLLCWPGPQATDYETYDDDGETTRYLQGDYCLWPVRVVRDGGQVRVGVGYPGGEAAPWLRRLTVEVVGLGGPPANVLLNGRPLPRLEDAGAAATTRGWAWDGGHLHATFSPAPGAVLVANL
jgi:alpha-D-xyloside xylohydrolase